MSHQAIPEKIILVPDIFGTVKYVSFLGGDIFLLISPALATEYIFMNMDLPPPP